MAYRVADDRLIAPHRYTEATGAIADHNTAEDELAVNERGAPLEAFRVLGKGDILYRDEADLNSISDVDKAAAGELLMVKNERYLNEQKKFGAIKELAASSSSSSDDYEQQKNAELRAEAEFRGLDVPANANKTALVEALRLDDSK